MKFRGKIQWGLLAYDVIILSFVALSLFLFPSINNNNPVSALAVHFFVIVIVVSGLRILIGTYNRIWRYEGTTGYLFLIGSDIVSIPLIMTIETLIPIYRMYYISYAVIVFLSCLFSITIRLVYRYLFVYGISHIKAPMWLKKIFSFLSGGRLNLDDTGVSKKINIAIIGAGRVGTSLCDELINNPKAYYQPCFFVDADTNKTGQIINGLKVFPENEEIGHQIKKHEIEEVVIALTNMSEAKRKQLFSLYKKYDCKIKIFDFPTTRSINSKRQMREFDIEDLLFREPVDNLSNKAGLYFNDKVVLVTGAGGSIGSELSRQISVMKPKQLILMDIYENGVYEVQQEILSSVDDIDLQVRIASIADKDEMEVLFSTFKPQTVIHAAAHKHVPLMEDSPAEAIYNNVYGTKVIADMSLKYGVEKFMLVSSDKAVNPTNVMGATKRMCEMLCFSYNSFDKTMFCATRFGNVLGSSGSVVPLFKRQINNGGPVTVTDKRMTRYFMTIPEAVSLILHACSFASKGELFVLDMGQPIKIYDLAKEMIDISGVPNIEIVETGLRPGEKLFEELLMTDDTHERTENELIFIEKDSDPLNKSELNSKLNKLFDAIDQRDNKKAKQALLDSVPTYNLRKEG